MSEHPPEPTDAIPAVESGTVRWFDATKQMGVIIRHDGSTLFLPPHSLAEGQEPLRPGQPVTFVVRTNTKGPYAAEVRATGAPPPTLQELAERIAQDLGEHIPQALAQIRRIIRHLGLEATQRFVAEAHRIEAGDGMLIPDGSRRRTLGGVFFAIVKDSLAPEQQITIFPPLHLRKPKKPKSTPAPSEPEPPVAPLTWDDRLALIATLTPQSGKASTVKVTLIGRPDQIEERAQVTVLTLTYTGPLPSLPKGIPVPAPVPTTTYSVYIGKKQWKTVAEALHNPEDTLIVEGTQVLDSATGTIAVFATKTTTKLLQQAGRQPKPPVDA